MTFFPSSLLEPFPGSFFPLGPKGTQKKLEEEKETLAATDVLGNGTAAGPFLRLVKGA